MLAIISGLVAVACSAPMPAAPFLSSQLVHSKLRGFQTQFGRNYTSADEESRRLDIFSQNLNAIYLHNAHNVTSTGVTLGVNQFTDLTKEEFKSIYLMDLSSLHEEEEATVAEMACSCQTYVPATIAGQSQYCVLAAAQSTSFNIMGALELRFPEKGAP